jgi:hypothetical protein
MIPLMREGNGKGGDGGGVDGIRRVRARKISPSGRSICREFTITVARNGNGKGKFLDSGSSPE